MKKIDLADYFNPTFVEHITSGIACNTPDRESAGATDRGMMEFLDRGNIDLNALKDKHNVLTKGFIRFPFSSKRKRMSTIIENAGDGSYNKRLLIKGASEIVKACCDSYLDESGNKQTMND